MKAVTDYVFGAAGLLPHGESFAWRTDLIAVHLASDLLIFLSYGTISIALVTFVRQRADLEYKHVFALFAAFILFCGLTHLMSAVTLWVPVYGGHGLLKATAAIVSVMTAVAIWPIIPQALALPSPSQLQIANRKLIEEVTQRREAEREARQAREELEARVFQRTRELAEANSRLRAILNNVVEAVVSIDAQGMITHWSPSAEAVFGYTSDEVVGRNVSMLMPEPDRSHHDQYLAAYHETGQRKIIGFGREVMGRRKDGTRFPMELSVGEARQDDEVEFVGVIRDISRKKETEEALRRALYDAESANIAKSQFLSNMSHELRTPLNSVIGFSDLLALHSGSPFGEKQKQQIAYINSAGHMLLDLINQVLDLSSIEAGHLTLDIQEVKINALVEDCVSLMRPLSDARSIVIETNLPEAAIHAKTDALRTRQALINFLSNAIKYNVEGGRVRVSLSADSVDTCRVTVSDSGRGIPADRFHEVFEPFNRLEAEKTGVEGTGIGLALTKRIIEGLDGRIGFESIVGKGSSFWFELPVVEAVAFALDEMPSAALKTTGCLNDRLLLYVEDNPANLSLMKDIVSELDGLGLIATHSAEAGIELARARRPDLIILDINLPGMDGFDALQVLKTDNVTAGIPVIALSADASPYRVEAGREAGFTEYLAKPIDLRRFMDVVDRTLGAEQSAV